VRHAFILDLGIEERAANDLSVGGVFIPNASVDFDDECHIVLRAGAQEVSVVARAVQVTEDGVGFQIEGMTRELRERIATLIALAKHGNIDLPRKATLTGPTAGGDALRRPAIGSIPPSNRRPDRRVAQGSLSPLVAFAPTQSDEALADKARSAQLAADNDDDDD
jgi:hypothetical protein